MLDGGAAIPDDAQSRGLSALCRRDIAEVELEPDGRDLRGDRVVDDRVEEVTASEDVGEIDPSCGRNVDEAVVRLLAVDDGAAQLRIHRNDPEALAAEVTGHRVA